MRKLELIIECCWDCPYCQYNGDYGRSYDAGWDCKHPDRTETRIIDEGPTNSTPEAEKNKKERDKILSTQVAEFCPLPTTINEADQWKCIERWDSERLTSEILDKKSKLHLMRLQQMILIAERTDFTVPQSKKLSPWLLKFAEEYRKDLQFKDSVLSAIRTGASMLPPNDVDCLFLLLEPGHPVETSLVAIKMIGRIFEAHPPSEIDEHKKMSNKIYQISKDLMSSHVITSSKHAAKAQLSIYALAAMGSSKIHKAVEKTQKMDVPWFATQTFRQLCKLRDSWSKKNFDRTDPTQKLLREIIQKIDEGSIIHAQRNVTY